MTNKQAPAVTHRWLPWMVALCLATVVWLIYLPGLSGGFVFDDLATIVENQNVHIETIDAESIERAAFSFEPGSGLTKRPLSMLTFGINHAEGGLSPRGYKVVNVLIHASNAVLVLLLAHLLIGLAWQGVAPLWPAAAVATAWAAHPLQVSTTLYVVQRMELLSLTFVLMALVSYVQGRIRQGQGRRGWPWILTAGPLVALGVAAKETAVLFPLYTLAIELAVLHFAADSVTSKARWKAFYAASTALAILFFTVVMIPQHWTASDELVRGYGTYERLLTQLRVLPMYLGQIVAPLPHHLTFYYDNLQPSRGWLEPPSTFGGAALLASLIATVLVALRRNMPLLALGIMLFFAAHALTSNIISLELAVEHRNYFAVFGVALAIADIVHRLPPKDHVAYKRLAVASIVATMIFMTTLRTDAWGDELHLATENASNNPMSGRASSDLAAVYLEMTDGYPNSPFNDFAMREFERGSLIPGASIISDQGLILSAAKAGRPIDDRWWQRLIGKLRHDRITADTTAAMFGLLRNRFSGVKMDDARFIEAFSVLFSRIELPPYSYAQVGEYAITKAGDRTFGLQMFTKAVELSRDDPAYVRQLISGLDRQGLHQEADSIRRTAARIGVDLSPPFEDEADNDAE